MKNCKHCNAEFQPKHATRGPEQMYCSQKCGQQAARIRRENKLKNEAISAQGNATKNADEIRNVASREMGRTTSNGWIHTDGSLVYLEKLYEAKNECNYLKMQVEKLTDELKVEREKNYHLEIELEEMGDPDQEGGMIGQVMSQFQKDPANTITFASALLKNLFNAKTTASQKPV